MRPSDRHPWNRPPGACRPGQRDAGDVVIEYRPAPPQPPGAAGSPAGSLGRRLRSVLHLAAFWHRQGLTARELYARIAGIVN